MKDMQNRLQELEKQQEESVMSMAETKKNMHEELELKEKQLQKAEEESKQFQAVGMVKVKINFKHLVCLKSKSVKVDTFLNTFIH